MKKMRRGSINTVTVAGAALLSAWTSPCAAFQKDATTTTADSGTMTFPLLSHHHVVDRRRRELRAVGENNGDRIGSPRLGLGYYDYDRIPHPHRTAAENRSSNDDGTADKENDNLRRLSQQQMSALYQGYGTHYIDIWVGSPAQRQTAVVDTGSSVTAFPCSECAECGHHADPAFREQDSETFRAHGCGGDNNGDNGDDESRCAFGKCDENGACVIEHNSGGAGGTDASGWTALEADDVAYTGGTHDRPMSDGTGGAASAAESPAATDPDGLDPARAPSFAFPLTFGCQTSATGYFQKQLASGIAGLDRRALSLWGQMKAGGAIERARFSLCFAKQPIASFTGSTAGAVTLGGVDVRLHKTPMVFAESVGEGRTASFKVRMRKMYLRQGNDQSVMSSPKSKYHQLDVSEEWLNGEEMYNLDSGTTDTYLIRSLSDEFRKVWKDIMGMDYTNDPIAFNSDSDLLKFPTLVLQMTPHNGGVGDEVRTSDPREVPGLAGNVDMATPNDVMVAIPPRHYMQRNSKDMTYTSRIYLDRENELGNVLGANAMMGHDILYDMDAARIGFSESDCDYAGLVAASAKSGSEDGEGAVTAGASGELSPADEDDDEYKICASMKCRAFFGLTISVFFVCFFLFARRYVTKREDERVAVRVGSNEYEMKASSRNIHAGGKNSSYSDADDWHGDDVTDEYSDERLPGGERTEYYREEHPHSYSDRHRSSGRRPERSSGRRDRSGSRESDRERRGGVSGEGRRRRDRGGGGQLALRSSSRDSAEGNHRSSHSIHSNRSTRSGISRDSNGSGGSGGSRETKRSGRSHRSSGSRESNRSHRSSGSSRRSLGSRERRSHADHRDRDPDDRHHHSDRSGGRQPSSHSNRYPDEYDDIPMPPSIA